MACHGGRFGTDLYKTISKKSLEIVLEAEILTPSEVLDFGKDKTPKALVFTRFSAFSIVFSFRLFCVKETHNARFRYPSLFTPREQRSCDRYPFLSATVKAR